MVSKQTDTPNDVTEYQSALDRYTLEKEGKAEASEPAKAKIYELIGLASFMTGSALVTSRPMLDKNVGGASLLGVGLVAADLHHQIFGGKMVEAAQFTFGGATEAMRAMGVVACSVLSGGTFYRMVKDGGVKNPLDPRWLSFIGVSAFFMGGHVMMQPDVKHWVESKFGETLTLAHHADREKNLEVPTAPFFKQLAFAIGGAHILAYGMLGSNNISKVIGSVFMVGPTMSLANLIYKGSQESHAERTDPETRIHFLSVTDPKEDVLQHKKSIAKPLVDEDGKFHFDRFAEMLGMGKQPQNVR